MSYRFQFDPDILHSVAGGASAVDIPRLNIPDLESAQAFILSYGFDLTQNQDVEKVWYFHRRALVLLTERLGFEFNEIPEVVRDRKVLEDIRRLLIFASLKELKDRDLQRWACALLRCMHVFVHAESDLFSSFSEDIQSQILGPFQKAIVHDGTTHKVILKGEQAGRGDVELAGFEIKPFKTSTSTVIKLLVKRDALAMKVFDKLGVRIITKNMFDVFQVIRALVEENLISFPHIMPDQSSNNLYPVDLFLETCEQIKKKNQNFSDEELHLAFDKKLAQMNPDAGMFRKQNDQSGQDFKFVKFISRKLIKVNPKGEGSFSFFYPFEVQIMDEKTYKLIQSGPAEHESYKERQKQAAKKRIFPEELVGSK